MEINTDIAARALHKAIAELRKSRRMTQDDISKALGVQRSSVAQWEKNHHKPPASILLKLSELAPEAEQQWWRDQASERAGIGLLNINTPGASAEPDAMRLIKLLKKNKGADALKPMADADMERELSFPASLFPDSGLLRAAHIQGAPSSLIAVIDVSRCKREGLVGRLIAVQVPTGVEIRWLTLEDGIYTLQPFQPGQAIRSLQKHGENSIVGLVRWVGEAPPAAKASKKASR